jgi:hypothetical protein
MGLNPGYLLKSFLLYIHMYFVAEVGLAWVLRVLRVLWQKRNLRSSYCTTLLISRLGATVGELSRIILSLCKICKKEPPSNKFEFMQKPLLISLEIVLTSRSPIVKPTTAAN